MLLSPLTLFDKMALSVTRLGYCWGSVMYDEDKLGHATNMSSLCINSSSVSAKGDGGVIARTDLRIVLLWLNVAVFKSFTRNPRFPWTDGPVSLENSCPAPAWG